MIKHMGVRVNVSGLSGCRSGVGRRLLLTIAAGVALGSAAAIADEQDAAERVAPHEAVREGNRLLRSGEPEKAVELYGQAEELLPEAREIAFDQGLALFELGRYEEARRRFQEAAAGQADRLADDALYSEGTTYHAEALANPEDTKAAIGKLESAMQRYQSVLAGRPDHQAAREANFKAALLRRRLQEQLQKQQQSQSEPSDDQQESEQEQQQEQSPQDNQEQEEQSDQQQSAQNEEQQDQEQQPAPRENEQAEQTRSEAAEQMKEEQVSREQAERALREMIQAVRQRKKDREEPVQVVPVRPVEKDW